MRPWKDLVNCGSPQDVVRLTIKVKLVTKLQTPLLAIEPSSRIHIQRRIRINQLPRLSWPLTRCVNSTKVITPSAHPALLDLALLSSIESHLRRDGQDAKHADQSKDDEDEGANVHPASKGPEVDVVAFVDGAFPCFFGRVVEFVEHGGHLVVGDEDGLLLAWCRRGAVHSMLTATNVSAIRGHVSRHPILLDRTYGEYPTVLISAEDDIRRRGI